MCHRRRRRDAALRRRMKARVARESDVYPDQAVRGGDRADRRRVCSSGVLAAGSTRATTCVQRARARAHRSGRRSPSVRSRDRTQARRTGDMSRCAVSRTTMPNWSTRRARRVALPASICSRRCARSMGRGATRRFSCCVAISMRPMDAQSDWAKARDADTLEIDALVTEFPPATKGAVVMPSAPTRRACARPRHARRDDAPSACAVRPAGPRRHHHA